MSKHEITTTLTTLGFQVDVVEKTLPALLAGYLAAVNSGLVEAKLSVTQLEYLGEITGEMTGKVAAVKSFLHSMQP